MTEFFTRCPHCQTVFRVQPQQLQAAQGRVRCGACFQVFAGTEHRVVEPAKADAGATVSTCPEPLSAPTLASAHSTGDDPGLPSLDDIFSADTTALLQQLQQQDDEDLEDDGVDDDASIHDQVFELEQERELMLAELDELDTRQEYDALDRAEPARGEQIQPRFSDDHGLVSDMDDADAQTASTADAIWSASPLVADDRAPLTEPAATEIEDTTATATTAPAAPTVLEPVFTESTREQAGQPAESVTEAMAVPEPAPELAQNAEMAVHPDVSDVDDGADFGDFSSEVGAEPEYGAEAQASAPAQRTEPTHGTAPDGADAVPFNSAAFNIDNWRLAPLDPGLPEPEPVRRLPWRALAYGLGCLALAALLVSQLLWPRRGDLREHEQFGPWVETLCRHVECQLPPRRNVTKIVFLQRSVIKDAQDPKKMHIDLLVQNNAGFDQAYPAIELLFTDNDGQLVARQAFQPAEYLQAIDLDSRMPDAVPVHISFSVIEPKPTVSGYEFRFQPSQG